MKKIGIMSMQRIKNYGSFLQAYSLKSNIEELGYEVEFVDYKVEKCINRNDSVNKEKKTFLYKTLRKIYYYINPKKHVYLKRHNFISAFEKDFFPLLGITEKRNERPKLDTLVIGSDEVFNCLQNNPDVGYSLELFGKDNNADKVITYAACFGYTTFEKLKMLDKDKEIAELLNNIDSISVRDENSGQVIKKLTNKEVEYHLDPVLIYNFDHLIPNNISLSNYIIVYAYDGRIQENEEEVIKHFAKKNNKKIVCIGNYQKFCDIYIAANPFELLAYFKKADYIITDTFHGTIFSIKYNKQFVTLIRESNKQKLGDLLSRLKLTNRQLTKIDDLEKKIVENIDFRESNKIIEEERVKSIEYLKANL